MLHIVNKSPLTDNTLDESVRFAATGAPILLLEDGVYGAKAGTSYASTIATILQNHELYVIDADIEARGITDIVQGVQKIGYDEFVDLVEKHRTLSWV